MYRTFRLVALIAGVATHIASAQELRLDDRDLAPFEDEGPVAVPEADADAADLPSRSEARDAVSARYDRLIDKLNEDLRQIRIELRERPARVAQARNRLESLQGAETDLRYEAYQRVVYRLPHPYFEDFDDAIEEALERRNVRASLEFEIAENEREIAALEGELAELQGDLDEALRLKMEAVDEFNRTAPPE